MSAILPSLGMATAIVVFLFLVAWIISELIEYVSLVDVVWALSFSAIAIEYEQLAKAPPIRRAPLVIMITLWSFRLASHLASRLKKNHPFEDARYEKLKLKWYGRFTMRWFLFFQVQGLSTVVLSIPFLLAFRNPTYLLDPVECVGIVLWILAFWGEFRADLHLSRFTANPENKGKTCRVGMWRYSRHPNYFCEFLIWCSFALFARRITSVPPRRFRGCSGPARSFGGRAVGRPFSPRPIRCITSR